jgi:peptidoglycan/LPS O-acetylase OafA/YrhL
MAPAAAASHSILSHSMSDRARSIDFLRGSAAMAVVIHHAVLFGNRPPTETPWFQALFWVLTHGHLGVPLFFVISGFCIHMRWARQQAATGEARVDFLAFWKRRFWRLYPPYLVALVITMALVLVAIRMGSTAASITRYPEPRSLWIGIDFVAHVFMLHGFHPALDEAGGNPVYWTLAREEWLYLIYFPLLFWRRSWGTVPAVIVTFVLGIVLQVTMRPVFGDSDWWRVINKSVITLWIQWSLGMLAAEAYVGLVKLPAWCRALWLVPVWAVLAEVNDAYDTPLTPALWGMTFFTLLNYCVTREQEGRWPNFALTNWLAHVGLFSYSLYLIHYPARYVMKTLMGPFAATRNPLLYLAGAVAITIGGYIAGWLFFLLIERHFLNAGRSPQPAPAVSATPAAAEAPARP